MPSTEDPRIAPHAPAGERPGPRPPARPAAETSEPLSLCLMGASTDTGNLGVSALCLSILRGIASRAPDARVTVFDNGRGGGAAEAHIDGRSVPFARHGLNDSRRFYRADSLWNVRVSLRLGGAGNAAAAALRDADAVLDITGGDSFTDLYGERRFVSGCVAKDLALEHSGGLVLLPQTYGPFRLPWHRREAARIVSSAEACWARDAASFQVLRALLGGRFDPSRQRCGVDVSFRLAPATPAATLGGPLAEWLGGDGSAPTVGLNVSGLTYVRAAEARRTHALVADYPATVLGIATRLLERTRVRIVLVPHVLQPRGHFESDRAACEDLAARLGPAARGRVAVAPDLDADEAKWVVSRTDWFCGTRMHAAIAALSTGVPAAALAYSAKTRGVFATCGLGDEVADLRTLDTAGAVESLWRSWERRDAARAVLARELPGVLAAADLQMDGIVAACRRLAARRRASAVCP